jgi:YVTN family beta-propeller protein
MKRIPIFIALQAATLLLAAQNACAGQAPGLASDPDVPISHRDRVYAAEQFSNTVSVTDPVDNKLLGVIHLGDPQPGNLSPLYRGQVLVHGMGYSPDHHTIAVVSIGSNSVTFIDTATNAVKHTTYVGRSPHEAFFTPDGKYGYVCSSFVAETDVVSVADHVIVGKVQQASPFCPNIAATPDGSQVWLTLKDTGKTQVFDARPPFSVLKTLDTGPITNHVNFVHTAQADDFSKVATIPVGKLPHGIWPSGDGSRVYVGLENDDSLIAIDTRTNAVIATIPIGQAPQALAYVANAVPEGTGTEGLQPLGVAGQAAHFTMVSTARPPGSQAPTSVTLFEQGLTQMLEASVTGLEAKHPYVLALAKRADGSGALQPLAGFMTNPAGAAIVNAVGPIRQLVRGEGDTPRRYLVIVPGPAAEPGKPVQIQTP